jgi:hypothetical protein
MYVGTPMFNFSSSASLLRKLLDHKLFRKKFDHKPFQKRLERKQCFNQNSVVGVVKRRNVW